MTTQNNPAFPNVTPTRIYAEGMTLRQYAAIKLKVPDAEEEWLNDMIRKSLLNDFAAKAMEAWILATTKPYMHDGRHQVEMVDVDRVAEYSFTQANAMLASKDAK